MPTVHFAPPSAGVNPTSGRREEAVTRLEGCTSFARAPDEIFDSLTDPRHELTNNPLVVPCGYLANAQERRG